jgi:hypothetical protein
MAKKSVDARQFVYVKVTLNYIKPPIWRRLRVPVAWRLDKLSDAILRGMGWLGGHLHAFEIGGRQYSDPAMLDDGWDHSVLIETKPVPPGETTPGCTAGARACPPEDCGGPPGYEGLLDALATPDKPESREILGWIEEDFDPEEFVLEDADRGVKSV